MIKNTRINLAIKKCCNESPKLFIETNEPPIFLEKLNFLANNKDLRNKMISKILLMTHIDEILL